jgi:hypothetical protein
MNLKVTICHTDTGAATTVISKDSDATKFYASWADALSDGESIGLLNSAEATAAKLLPPGLPMHTSADLDFESVLAHGFQKDSPRPPQA